SCITTRQHVTPVMGQRRGFRPRTHRRRGPSGSSGPAHPGAAARGSPAPPARPTKVPVLVEVVHLAFPWRRAGEGHRRRLGSSLLSPRGCGGGGGGGGGAPPGAEPPPPPPRGRGGGGAPPPSPIVDRGERAPIRPPRRRSGATGAMDARDADSSRTRPRRSH